jgi:hypothetical protein
MPKNRFVRILFDATVYQIFDRPSTHFIDSAGHSTNKGQQTYSNSKIRLFLAIKIKKYESAKNYNQSRIIATRVNL